MSKFQTIGGAWYHQSKTGKKFISLSINEDALKAIHQEDLMSKLCLFQNESKKSEKSPDFSISAPMPDDFQSKFNTKEDK